MTNCGSEEHEVLVSELEGCLYFKPAGQMLDIFTEFRLCGCVTWRQQ